MTDQENLKFSQNEKLNENSINTRDMNIPEGKKLCCIELRPGISFLNLFTFFLVQFSYVCAFTFLDSSQDYLLEDQSLYNIKKTDSGTANGNLLLTDTLFLIVFIFIYGSLHDVLGRKFLCAYGFAMIGLGILLYPMAGKLYPNLLFIRLIFANGECAVTTQPLLADYVSHKTKGFSGGIASVASGAGSLFAIFVLMSFRHSFGISNSFYIAAGFCFFVSIFCIFGVRNIPNLQKSEFNCLKKGKEIVLRLKQGLLTLKGNFKLSYSIYINAICRVNTLMQTLYLVLWVQTFYDKSDKSQKAAYDKGQIISGVGMTIGLISAGLFGFIFNKFKISNLLLLLNIIIFGGYVIFLTSTDPSDWTTMFGIALADFGIYGMLTVGFVALNKFCGNEARGAVMGLSGLFGAVGILILATLGGYTFDNVSKNSVFYGAAFLSLVAAILMMIPYLRNQMDEFDDKGEEIKVLVTSN